MNVRLKKSFEFYTGLFYQGQFLANHYFLDLDMIAVSEDRHDHSIAYERLKFWIGDVLDDSLLIGHEDPALDTVLSLEGRVMVLPDEPVDQIIGIMLYLKLNAIMENRLVVAATHLRSVQGDMTGYVHIGGENLGPNLGKDGWWSDARPVYSLNRRAGAGNVINLARSAEWADYDLAWKSDPTDPPGNVLVAKFPRDEH